MEFLKIVKRNAEIRRLITTHPQLFELLPLGFSREEPESLYRDGECGIIELGLRHYRYYHESMNRFID